MASIGTVRTWDDAEGWGVVDSADTPGGCWTHYSVVAVAGQLSLPPGRPVHLEWEPVVDQDGYRYRALRTWPVGADPVDTPPQGSSNAYRSTLTITFDRPPDGADRH